jgi:hypothetical protein
MTIFQGLVYIFLGAGIIYSLFMTLAFIGCQKEIRDLKRLLLKKTLADVKEKRERENISRGLN